MISWIILGRAQNEFVKKLAKREFWKALFTPLMTPQQQPFNKNEIQQITRSSRLRVDTKMISGIKYDLFLSVFILKY